jgi:rare lipoprotein A
VLTGTTIAALGLNPSAHDSRADAGAALARAAADRTQQRADRSEQRTTPSAEASPLAGASAPAAAPSVVPVSAPPLAPPPVPSSRAATPSPSKPTTPKPTPPAGGGGVVDSGQCQASFYTDEGSRTANGETFHTAAFTAAHKTLKFNTKVRVTNVKNGKSVVVRINDRGPFVAGRCIDLTPAAFNTISSTSAGVATVKYEVLQG